MYSVHELICSDARALNRHARKMYGFVPGVVVAVNDTKEKRHQRGYVRVAFPGLQDMADRRRALIEGLAAARRASGVSQTEVAARMGTSQSAVARLESGELDARMSTLERYAAAVGHDIDWQARPSEESS